MRTNRNWVNRVLRASAILVFVLLPVSAIAAELSVNKQLLQAAEKGSLEQIKALLEKGGDVNAANDEGRTVLTFAAWSGNLEVVRFLIDKGLDVNAKDEKGQTALSIASANNLLEIVLYLGTHGAK
jgi:ankyrin repeat protein